LSLDRQWIAIAQSRAFSFSEAFLLSVFPTEESRGSYVTAFVVRYAPHVFR
jgi:hypothetical protein